MRQEDDLRSRVSSRNGFTQDALSIPSRVSVNLRAFFTLAHITEIYLRKAPYRPLGWTIPPPCSQLGTTEFTCPLVVKPPSLLDATHS